MVDDGDEGRGGNDDDDDDDDDDDMMTMANDVWRRVVLYHKSVLLLQFRSPSQRRADILTQLLKHMPKAHHNTPTHATTKPTPAKPQPDELIQFLAHRRKHGMNSYDIWRNGANAV